MHSGMRLTLGRLRICLRRTLHGRGWMRTRLFSRTSRIRPRAPKLRISRLPSECVEGVQLLPLSANVLYQTGSGFGVAPTGNFMSLGMVVLTPTSRKPLSNFNSPSRTLVTEIQVVLLRSRAIIRSILLLLILDSWSRISICSPLESQSKRPIDSWKRQSGKIISSRPLPTC